MTSVKNAQNVPNVLNQNTNTAKNEIIFPLQVQFFFGPPSQLQAFLKSERCEKADLSSLISCFPIGGFVPSVLVQTMKKIIPKCLLLTTYGMTEVGGSLSCTTPNELEEYPKSAGRLVPGVEVKIIHEQTGEKCGIGEEGEIYAKVPVPSMGYYKDEIATREAFDSEGYFITGDLGYFDDTGRLYIVGRKKEIFKNCGFAVWPAELENLIVKHPNVQTASVVSVYDNDVMSDLPAALVVKVDGSSITEKDVYAIIAGELKNLNKTQLNLLLNVSFFLQSDQMASYKRLDGGIYFVNELPMTPSGKVIRPKVKEIAQQFFEAKKQSTTK